MPTVRRAVLALSCLLATSSSAAGPEPLADGPWPRSFTVGLLTLSIYQPEVQRWDGRTLSLRAAALVRKGERQTYGLVHLEALTEVDEPRKVVRLAGVRVTRTEFPAVPEKERHWKGLFGKQVADRWELPLDRLKAEAAVAEAEAERARAEAAPASPPPPAPVPGPESSPAPEPAPRPGPLPRKGER